MVQGRQDSNLQPPVFLETGGVWLNQAADPGCGKECGKASADANGPRHRARRSNCSRCSPDYLRPIYATAFYAGLRRGELRGLRWEDVNLAKGVIQVRRSWDDYAGEITPKSAKGTRTVPLTALLRDHLVSLKTTTGRDGRDFGSTADRPFTPSHIRKQAANAWEAANKQRAEQNKPLLVRIELHSCRHTFVSLMHDAGLSLERIGDYVGHGSTYTTDCYRHLLEGTSRRPPGCSTSTSPARTPPLGIEQITGQGDDG